MKLKEKKSTIKKSKVLATKQNVLASLHELTKQNTLQTGRSFCEIAKKSVQVYCFRIFVRVANFCIAIIKMHTQHSHPPFRCSKSTIKTLEPVKKYA